MYRSTGSLTVWILEAGASPMRAPCCVSGTYLKNIQHHAGRRAPMLKTGSVVDATLINAPSSTKNKDGERDWEMHQVRKATSGTSA